MAVEKPTLYLNLYWHMHQPDYRDIVNNEYVLPWTYLHAIKDYSDMAYHLEQNSKARVTFNFVPILLEQLEDYSQQFRDHEIRDPLLALLIEPHLERIDIDKCRLLVESCFKSHHDKMLSPFPQYQRLLEFYKLVESMDDAVQMHYLSEQFRADLLVWYHLAWCGESLRKTNPTVQRLMKKGEFFTIYERLQLFNVIGNTIRALIARYRALMHRNQIEVSTTPYYHPILPLLLDFESTKDAMPEAPLPEHPVYPGGEPRAEVHIKAAQEAHQHYFSVSPHGMWPAEGAVSKPALGLLAKHGVKWAATGQGVLANSLKKSELPADSPMNYLYQPYRIVDGEHEILCFFRDDVLSDKIGFEYAKIHTHDAVKDFVKSLEKIQQNNPSEQSKVVSVILDGENAWEYFPYNGYYFLNELYEALSEHADIEMTTFSDIVEMYQPMTSSAVSELPEVAAGSWVYGTFSTWIGSKDKNKGWDLLCDAKLAFDEAIANNQYSEETLAATKKQLAICEGSDWFWWFGDYNSSDSVKSFDRLYRLNLMNLYRLLELPIPDVLHESISTGGGAADNAGTMRRGQV